jgi:tetratricopeptide (TPR) repeat protein
MDVKEKLLDLLRRGYEEEQAFVRRLSDAERSYRGTPEQWSAKDLVAHLHSWKTRTLQRLEALEHGETPPSFSDWDAENAAIYAAHHDRPWDDVLRESTQVYRDLVAKVQAFSEDELVDAQRFPTLNGQPLWRSFTGNGYSHPLAHLAEFYARHGQQDYATRLQETGAEMLAALDDSDSWRGTALYNLACYYAIVGQKDKAITQLGQALRLNPDLVEWSTQDPDFASIRDDAGYRALYSS